MSFHSFSRQSPLPIASSASSSASSRLTNNRSPSPYDLYAPDPTAPNYSHNPASPVRSLTPLRTDSPTPSSILNDPDTPSHSPGISRGRQRQLRRERLLQQREALREQERQERRRAREVEAANKGFSHGYTNLLNVERQPSPTRARGLHPDSKFALPRSRSESPEKSHIDQRRGLPYSGRLQNPFGNEFAISPSTSPTPSSPTRSPNRTLVGRPLPPPPSPPPRLPGSSSPAAATSVCKPDTLNKTPPIFDDYFGPPRSASAMSNPQLRAVAAADPQSNRNSHASNTSGPSVAYVSNAEPNDYSYPAASPPSPVYGPNIPLHQDFDMVPPPRLNGSVAGSSSRSASQSRASRSASSLRDPFQDDHYSNYASARSLDPRLGEVNPQLIADDGDDGISYHRSGRSSMINLHKKRDSIAPSVKAATAMGGAVAMNALPGGGSGSGSERSTAYGSPEGVKGMSDTAAAAGFNTNMLSEKSAETKLKNRKRWKWFIIITFTLLTVGAILGGVLGGYFANHPQGKKNKSSSSNRNGSSASDDTDKNGILTKDSAEIKALLNNKNLHKVFPGMDYTPMNTQYPDCLADPPSQNNVTRDMAVLSQLTNIIRVYGTDCNQTEMVLQAFDYLGISSTMSIWLGVWQDTNETTNARQLEQMWSILDTYGDTPFEGLIIANEALYREDLTETELGTLMASVRTNLTSKSLSLPVGTSDLGDKWTSSLADKSDVIMSNIHPFFGGITYADAANWTYSFFTDHNADFFKSDAKDNIISEIGWPTSGGTNCASGVTSCDETNGSVASVDGLNVLLEDWVCDALTNGTNYFWFSAFDEPWKARFNTKGKAWEDQWGLFDVNRNLKDGVTIPDCGGKTVS